MSDLELVSVLASTVPRLCSPSLRRRGFTLLGSLTPTVPSDCPLPRAASAPPARGLWAALTGRGRQRSAPALLTAAAPSGARGRSRGRRVTSRLGRARLGKRGGPRDGGGARGGTGAGGAVRQRPRHRCRPRPQLHPLQGFTLLERGGRRWPTLPRVLQLGQPSLRRGDRVPLPLAAVSRTGTGGGPGFLFFQLWAAALSRQTTPTRVLGPRAPRRPPFVEGPGLMNGCGGAGRGGGGDRRSGVGPAPAALCLATG